MVNKLREAGINEEAIYVFKQLADVFKEYGRYSNRSAKKEKYPEEYEKEGEGRRRFFETMNGFANVEQVDDIIKIIHKTQDEYDSLLFDVNEKLKNSGIPEGERMDIAHYFRTPNSIIPSDIADFLEEEIQGKNPEV